MKTNLHRLLRALIVSAGLNLALLIASIFGAARANPDSPPTLMSRVLDVFTFVPGMIAGFLFVPVHSGLAIIYALLCSLFFYAALTWFVLTLVAHFASKSGTGRPA